MNTQQLMYFLPFVLIFVVFYFMLIRPQNKERKKRMQMLNALKKGDKVITIGGLHGSIVDINEHRVTLKVGDKSRLVFERSAINAIVSRDINEVEASSKDKPKEEKKVEGKSKKKELTEKSTEQKKEEQEEKKTEKVEKEPELVEGKK